ncbi:MAG TPA: hypothetical protein VFG22_14720 [Polyangiales bacterium]|jgi:hypothetical protein|nr:hypothetical protein [Polyangiales bacterium]
MNRFLLLPSALVALSAAACSSNDSGGTAPADPFAPQADTSEGLTNVSADLMEVLEDGALHGACEAYWDAVADGTDTRRARLLCGKEMFFYEGFDTVGVPTVLLETNMALFPDLIGAGATGVGMIEDPTSADGLPLGFGPGKDFAEGVPSLAFTCASCHFGQLPDGRYVMGAPNHDFEYGELNLAIAVLPTATILQQDLDPAAEAKLAPYFQAIEDDPSIVDGLIASLAPLIGAGASIPEFSAETQAAYAGWKSGTMDFVITPLPLDDEVHTVSKIMSLWGIADEADVAAYEMDGALLAHTGVTASVANFLEGFVILGDGDLDAWDAERLGPLDDYLHSLRAPSNPEPSDAVRVAEGQQLFGTADCIDCHDGARGSSRTVFTFDEIGSDTAMMYWLDRDLDGQPCCDVDLLGRDALTHGLRAQRLTGVWSAKRLLHNGSVDSLEDLFCVNGMRPTITESPYSDRGHMFTCDGLSETEKAALIAYLRSL